MQLKCATCQIDTMQINFGKGTFFLCSQCKGIALTFALLKQHVTENDFRTIWSNSQVAHKSLYSCPSCRNSMVCITDSCVAPFDFCTGCKIVTFSATQKVSLPASFQLEKSINKLENLSVQERKDFANALAETSKISHAEFISTPSLLQKILGAIGLAVPERGLPRFQIANLNSKIIILMVLISFFSLFFLTEDTWRELVVFRPWEFFDHFGINLVLSFFAHVGFWHLLANVYYLYAFGPKVEEILGAKKFAQLVILSALAGDVIYSFSGAELPTVGSSAAVMGILTFYGLSFSEQRVGFYTFFFIYVIRWIWMPVWLAMILLFMQNLFGSFLQTAGSGSVRINFLSHMGGIFVGYLFWKYRRKP